MKNNTKKMSVAQAKQTSELVAKTAGLEPSVVFEKMVKSGLVSNGRGCYTEFQEFFNSRYNAFKEETLKEAKKLGLKPINSKGQTIDIALNHKAVK